MFDWQKLSLFLAAICGPCAGLQQVTCGSLIKLKNAVHGVRLHSHNINYKTGSGQQSVVGSSNQVQINHHMFYLTF